jgi:hypothetical protein
MQNTVQNIHFRLAQETEYFLNTWNSASFENNVFNL